MKKVLKFNLILDGKPCRTLQDVRDNFNVEAILVAYEQTLLQKWLTSRGYERELQILNEIGQEKDRKMILTKIFEAFEMEADAKEYYDMLIQKKREEEKKRKLEEGRQTSENRNLYESIINNTSDVTKMKSDIEKLTSVTLGIKGRNFYGFCEDLINKKNYLAIICLLINRESRKYLKFSDAVSDYKENKFWIKDDKRRKVINLILQKEFANFDFFGKVRKFGVERYNGYHPLYLNAKCLILHVEENDKISDNDKTYSSQFINREFIVVSNRCQYHASCAYARILYIKL